MSRVLVDSSVLLDVLTSDPVWYGWSAGQIERAVDRGAAINPLIYAEASVDFHNQEEVDEAFRVYGFDWLPLPRNAAFLAGQAHWRYRRQGGAKRSPLPDFYIGAHAQVLRMDLLTRDVNRYRGYFPDVPLIHP